MAAPHPRPGRGLLARWRFSPDPGFMGRTGPGAAPRPWSLLITYNQMVVSKTPNRDDEKAADLLFGALADPTRRDIFRRAHEGRFSVSALAREYPISVAAVQKHVAVLERAELVSKHRAGRESIVRAETDALARAHAALDRLEAVWRDRVERMDQILETDKGDS
jgi:DNA-binding transcriptional ArsR family regulator